MTTQPNSGRGRAAARCIPLILGLGLLCWTVSVCAQPSFTDATSQAGVANSTSGNQTRLATNLAWGDYDGDGDPDLYVTNWGTSVSPVVAVNRLYRNNGNGSFSDVAQTAEVADSRNSIAAQWVDYDNDGHLDLYVVNFSEQDQLYRNSGTGSFTRVTASAGVNVISQGSETGAAWGDYDGDGDLDYYLCKFYFKNALYRNNGDGSFSGVGSAAGVDDIRNSSHAAWADYDGDGDLDLYVVNQEQNNALYRNDGTGAFTEVACALSIDNTDIGQHARWVDYDGDGDPDLHLANIGADALYRNDGGGDFVDVASGDIKAVSDAWISWAGAWADYDLDGSPDVFVTAGSDSRSGQVSHLFVNDGAGTFADGTASAGLATTGSGGRSAGVADYDGDGDLDLYLLNSGFPAFEGSRLYENQTSATSSVIVSVRRKAASGTAGAADGIGSTVTLMQSGQVLGSCLIASGPDALQAVFGVQSGLSYSVAVTFADGTTASLDGVSAGDAIKIVQP